MGTFLSKAILGLVLLQSPQNPSPDSVRAELWARVTADSTNGPVWLELGRAYLQRGTDYHSHRRPMTVDTVWAHATLDTAQLAFERAARFSPGTRTADSARLYRVYTYGELAYVDWETGGTAAATLTWHTLPEGLRIPPVLEELGENLLRACPHQGMLFTAGETDTQTAWYLRFSRGLRPDLTIVPWARSARRSTPFGSGLRSGVIEARLGREPRRDRGPRHSRVSRGRSRSGRGLLGA